VSDVSQWNGHQETDTQGQNARDGEEEHGDVKQQNPPESIGLVLSTERTNWLFEKDVFLLLPADFSAQDHCVN